ncbi:MAG TPA: exonuclease domain-containing protein [Pyrinomonadaceae bacterium]|nr:exonuclease domain-containing protein [Pyrinomonadaceae bacterium]
MHPHSNLISDSLLINETIDFLVSVGGTASATSIVEYTMNIRNSTPALARLLMSDLAARDSRLVITDDNVELIEVDHDAIELEAAGFVVFDLETTGAKTPPCRVTEIGAYKVEGGRIVGEFHTLVNPEMPIPFFITMLTGITDGMVKDAPKFCDVADDFLKFIGDSVLVAHNAGFDMRFLNHEISRLHEDYRLANPSLCTVQLARRLLPDAYNHKLKTLAEYFSVELINHHRANADALATAKIFINLLTDLHSRGVRDLGSARKFSEKRSYVRPGEVTTGEPAAARY